MRARSAVALGIAAYLAVLAATAPATLVAPQLAAATGARLEIGEASGTIWRGEARGRILPGGAAPVALDRLAWKFLPARLAAGEAAAVVEFRAAGVSGRGEAARGFAGWSLRGLEAGGEAGALSALSPLIASAQPGGALSLAAPRLDWDGKSLRGQARLDWKGATSSLSEVRPLGSYRLSLKAEAGPAALELTTTEGALRLAGRGTLDPAGGVSFAGEARAEAARAKELEPLLALLGPTRADGAHAIEWRAP